MKILNDQGVVNTVKCLGEINKGKDHSVGSGLVHVGVNEVEQPDQVMVCRSSCKASAVSRVEVRSNKGH